MLSAKHESIMNGTAFPSCCPDLASTSGEHWTPDIDGGPGVLILFCFRDPLASRFGAGFGIMDRGRQGGPYRVLWIWEDGGICGVGRIKAEALRAFVRDILEHMEFSPEECSNIADGLVEANLAGVDTHGVLRVPQYVASVQQGHINPRPDIKVVSQRGVTAVIDADGGYGYTPSLQAADLAATLATTHGMGAVAVRNSHHFGMAALYAERAARQNVIGMVFTNTQPILKPPGGMRPVTGNNPVAFAFPGDEGTVALVVDMALSVSAFGKIRLAAVENRSIPEGWAYDREGMPTTDAKVALDAGLLAPIGDYKGFGLSVATEVLAGILTESPFGVNAAAHQHRAGGVGHLIMAIAVDCFTTRERFQEGVQELSRQIKGSTSPGEAHPVWLPGEIEQARRAERAQEGIPVSNDVLGSLRRVAQELGRPLPAWLQNLGD